MADAFVRGGSGVVQLHQIPAAQGRAFWPLSAQIFEADLYESENPDVTVRRPWESEQQHEARLAQRKRTPLAEPKLNMDPARALPELKRRQRELAGLTAEHPEYDKLFTALVGLIHDLERVLDRKPTRYVKGTIPAADGDPISPEMVEKLATYKKLKPEKRQAAIAASENVELLELVRQVEPVAELQALAAQRIEQLRSAS